jgi:uncharacterized membrane protein
MSARGVSHTGAKRRRELVAGILEARAKESRTLKSLGRRAIDSIRGRGGRNARRELRRSLGWPSGRQWTKMRKADAREERERARQ